MLIRPFPLPPGYDLDALTRHLESLPPYQDALTNNRFDEVRAALFAVKWHGLAEKTYGGQPYAVHLAAGRQVLADFDVKDEAITVAIWVHDVVEDTQVSKKDVVHEFGCDVEMIVDAVTGEGETRKEQVLSAYKKIISVGWRAAVLKLADRIANSEASKGKPHYLATYRGEQPGFEAMIAVAVALAAPWAQQLAARMMERVRAALAE